MNKTRNIWLVLALAASALVAGCGGGGGGDDAPAVATSVPDSAAVSSASFLDFIQSLTTDETSEPLTISDAFSVPADETDGVRPLT